MFRGKMFMLFLKEYSKSIAHDVLRSFFFLHNLVSETIYVCVMHFVPNVTNVAR